MVTFLSCAVLTGCPVGGRRYEYRVLAEQARSFAWLDWRACLVRRRPHRLWCTAWWCNDRRLDFCDLRTSQHV